MSEIALSQRVVQDPRFQVLVRRWVTEGLPREWLVAQSRQLAREMARESRQSLRVAAR